MFRHAGTRIHFTTTRKGERAKDGSSTLAGKNPNTKRISTVMISQPVELNVQLPNPLILPLV